MTDRDTAILEMHSQRHELLCALKALVDAEWMMSHDWGGDREAVLEQARAAIAKAEGTPATSLWSPNAQQEASSEG